MSELVSIIVPVYNVEKYIEDCIASLVNQTYRNIEIIIINDGSTDRTQVICKKFENKYTFVKLYNFENHGVSFARNQGIQKANGKYLICIDSDDVIELDMIEQMLMVAERNDYEIVLCGIDFFNTFFYKKRRHRYENFIVDMEAVDINIFSEFARNNPLAPYFGAPYNKLIKKSVLIEKKLLYEVGVQLAEDMCFCYNVYSHINKIGICGEILYHHRVNAGVSLSRKKHSVAEVKERMSEIDKVIKKFVKKIESPKEEYIKYYEKLIVFYIGLILKSGDVSILKRKNVLRNLCKENKDLIRKINIPMKGIIQTKNYLLYVVLMRVGLHMLNFAKWIVLKINRVLKFL